MPANYHILMQHVLHLASWYPNRTGPQDGDFIQRHLQALSALIPVHVIFVVKDPAMRTRFSRIINRNGNLTETIIYYKPWSTGIKAIDRLISFREYNRLLKNEILQYIRQNGSPDLLHVHVAMRAGIAALYLFRKSGIPYVVSEHWSGYATTDPDNLFTRGRVFQKYTSVILENASAVIAVSRDLSQILSGLFRIRKSHIIYNVVNTGFFNYRPVQGDLFRFIHISNMHPIKNLTGIFRAFAGLNLKRSDWKLRLVGEIDRSYQALAVELGINDQLEWTGSVPHHQIPALINDSDALVIFSNHETLSCVICESLCCGVPVIASTVGGIPEIVNASNGMLCAAGDISGLCFLLEKMMEQHSGFQGQNISIAASKLFNEQAVSDKFVSIYKEVSIKVNLGEAG